jgi:hypothetical protein
VEQLVPRLRAAGTDEPPAAEPSGRSPGRTPGPAPERDADEVVEVVTVIEEEELVVERYDDGGAERPGTPGLF